MHRRVASDQHVGVFTPISRSDSLPREVGFVIAASRNSSRRKWHTITLVDTRSEPCRLQEGTVAGVRGFIRRVAPTLSRCRMR